MAWAVDATIFGAVVVVAVAVGVVVAVVCAVAGRDAYAQIGRGGLWSEKRSGPGASPDQRDEEIRQMTLARNAHRARRAPDQPEEAAEPEDPGLADEIRQLAVARNVRRRAQGLAPLDVEAEVARRLARAVDPGDDV